MEECFFSVSFSHYFQGELVMSRIQAVCFLMALAVITSSTVPATADWIPITVNNFSFESPAQSDGGWKPYPNAPTGWSMYVVGSGAQIGVQNPQDAQFPGTTYVSPSQPGNQPSPADSLQNCYVNVGISGGYPSNATYIYQSLETIESNYNYRATAAIGKRLDFQSFPSGWELSLRYGGSGWNGTLLASIDQNNSQAPTAGTFVDLSCMFNSNNYPDAIGKTLYVVFKATPPDTKNLYQVCLDNIRVEKNLVPEPGMFALLTCGLFGLLCYAWRKRR
jgi:hypothetical protein